MINNEFIQPIDCKLLVVKAISTKTEKPYTALVLDVGYRKMFLSCNGVSPIYLCSELLGMGVAEFNSLPYGEYEVISND